jgi:hypothetical protein
MASGSPGASALADGGTQAIDSGNGGTGPSPGAADRTGPEATGSDSTIGAPDDLTRVGSRGELDTGQRYEPHIQTESGGLERISPPKDANWLVDREGFERIDRGTDDPLYFKGESDGGVYDLRGAAESSSVYGDESSRASSTPGTNSTSIREV